MKKASMKGMKNVKHLKGVVDDKMLKDGHKKMSAKMKKAEEKGESKAMQKTENEDTEC
jgi:hypothetical protein